VGVVPDAFAYCTELVRAADHDRYLATLFAAADRRGALFALYAFNSEVARVRDVARQPLPGEIRLQWWSEVLRGERDGEANANPVASALLATIARYQLGTDILLNLIEARRFDLYDEPMASVADLEAYLKQTFSAVFALAGKILAGDEAEAVSDPSGIAYGVAALLQAFARHAARGKLYVPVELLDRYGVRTSDVLAGRSSPGLNAALGDLCNLARQHLAVVRENMARLPAAALPAFLPLSLVRPMLDRLERNDAFVPRDIPTWRRQWLIWRAARDPTRIAK
jgi:15-cis-phytoene synthase